jgi:hypothetical protein
VLFVIARRYKPIVIAKRYKPIVTARRYKPIVIARRYKPIVIARHEAISCCDCDRLLHSSQSRSGISKE